MHPNAAKSQPPLHAVVPESDTGRYFGIDPSAPTGSANGQESYSLVIRDLNNKSNNVIQCLCSVMLSQHLVI